MSEENANLIDELDKLKAENEKLQETIVEFKGFNHKLVVENMEIDALKQRIACMIDDMREDAEKIERLQGENEELRKGLKEITEVKAIACNCGAIHGCACTRIAEYYLHNEREMKDVDENNTAQQDS